MIKVKKKAIICRGCNSCLWIFSYRVETMFDLNDSGYTKQKLVNTEEEFRCGKCGLKADRETNQILRQTPIVNDTIDDSRN